MLWCCGRSRLKDESAAEVPNFDLSSSKELSLEEAPEIILQTPLDVATKKFVEDAETQQSEAFFESLVSGMTTAVATGTINVSSSYEELPKIVNDGVNSSQDKFPKFLSSLHTVPGKRVYQPTHSRMASQDSELNVDLSSAYEESTDELGIPNLDYRKHLVKRYLKLPAVFRPFISLPFLDHYLVIGRPTMAPSAGLENYRKVVPKAVRAAAPFVVVIDKPGKLQEWKGDRYIWVEFPMGDVFMLDVSKMKDMKDYTATLTKKGKQNFRDKQKKFKAGPVSWEEVPLKNDRKMVEKLWPLYKNTGEKNGFLVMNKSEFFNFHLTTPNLRVMLVYDVRDKNNPKLISFCTSAQWKDVLMPLWCGTDYSNELHRSCATYFNIHYNYVALAIADPTINWIDLGASRRTAKTMMGFKPYPSAGYFRCKNAVMQALVETILSRYFNLGTYVVDP